MNEILYKIVQNSNITKHSWKSTPNIKISESCGSKILIMNLTVGPWADVKNGFTWKIIIVLRVRAGHGEQKFS